MRFKEKVANTIRIVNWNKRKQPYILTLFLFIDKYYNLEFELFFVLISNSSSYSLHEDITYVTKKVILLAPLLPKLE